MERHGDLQLGGTSCDGFPLSAPVALVVEFDYAACGIPANMSHNIFRCRPAETVQVPAYPPSVLDAAGSAPLPVPARLLGICIALKVVIPVQR